MGQCGMPPRLSAFMPEVNRPIDVWVLPGPILLDEAANRAQLARQRNERSGPLPKTIWIALWRGLRCLCPTCGATRLFSAFLKPVDHCSTCHQDWIHHRADDFPPYIVILVLGHIIVPGMASVTLMFHPPMWVSLAIWLPLALVFGIGLLQPAKGAVIAYQWWHGMGGFEGRDAASATPSQP